MEKLRVKYAVDGVRSNDPGEEQVTVPEIGIAMHVRCMIGLVRSGSI